MVYNDLGKSFNRCIKLVFESALGSKMYYNCSSCGLDYVNNMFSNCNIYGFVRFLEKSAIQSFQVFLCIAFYIEVKPILVVFACIN